MNVAPSNTPDIRSRSCPYDRGDRSNEGQAMNCTPAKALELADRAQAVCDAQHGAGDRCCLMREVADVLRECAAREVEIVALEADVLKWKGDLERLVARQSSIRFALGEWWADRPWRKRP